MLNLSVGAARVNAQETRRCCSFQFAVPVGIILQLHQFPLCQGKAFMRSLKSVCNIYSVSLIKGITTYKVTGSVPNDTSSLFCSPPTVKSSLKKVIWLPANLCSTFIQKSINVLSHNDAVTTALTFPTVYTHQLLVNGVICSISLW